MTLIRQRALYCGTCRRTVLIEADLDRVAILPTQMPMQCETPEACLDEFEEGMLDPVWIAEAKKLRNEQQEGT